MSDGRFQKQTQLISDISYAYTECYADCQFIHLFILRLYAYKRATAGYVASRRVAHEATTSRVFYACTLEPV